MVSNPEEARILYLTEDYENRNFMNWNIDWDNTYVNFFKKEGALVVKSGIANMINSTLIDKSCI